MGRPDEKGLLMKKTVLISGGSSGIGKSVALEFAKHNFGVHIVGRNLSRLKEVQKLIPDSFIYENDFEVPEKLVDLKNKVSENIPNGLDVLVNNAGVFSRSDAFKSDLDLWKKMFTVNLFASAEITRLFLPELIKTKGSIVNVASTLGLRGAIGTSVYSASKAAMISWTQVLAAELGKNAVRVNVVCPGIVDTPIHDFHSYPEAEKSRILQSMNSLQPLGRIGQPEEIAKAIYFLASADSSWTTGSVLSVDGGINVG